MLRIRLQRRGKNKYATYRVVVAHQHAPIKGRFIADLGHYNPHTNEFKVVAEKVNEWIKKGAQPTPTVYNQLIGAGIVKGEKLRVWKPKKQKSKE